MKLPELKEQITKHKLLPLLRAVKMQNRKNAKQLCPICRAKEGKECL